MLDYIFSISLFALSMLLHVINVNIFWFTVTSLCYRARRIQSGDLQRGGSLSMDEEVNYGKEAKDLFSAIEVLLKTVHYTVGW